MLIKKKIKFTAFKLFKDFIIITLINFNKRRIFKALNNLNISVKLTLHDFKSFNYAFTIIIN